MSDIHTHPGPTPQSGPPAPTPGQGGNGLATAGFVLGLLGLLGSWIPLLNIVGIILGVIGVVLAAVGLVKSKRTGSGKGLALAGVVMGVLAVIVALVINAAFVGAVDEAIDETLDEPGATSSSTVDANEDADQDPEVQPAFVDGVLTTEDVKIEITSRRIIQPGQAGNEYSDKPVIAFYYKTTNVSGEETDPTNAWIFAISAFQDNNPNAENELEIASLPDDRFRDTQLENIKKGGTVENAVGYELDDLKTPVDLVAAELFGGDLGTVTYNLK